MDRKVLISVVIPIYKVEKYITNTLSALLNQTMNDFEIILVDDGTPDRSAIIAEEYLREKGRRYTILHQKNSGQGEARNVGLKVAKGEWIYYLDSDDIIQPFTFELMHNVVKKENCIDMVFTEFQYVHDSDIFRPAVKKDDFRFFSKEEMLHGFLIRKIVPLVPGTLYRRSFLEENGIVNCSIRWSEDQHFMWQVLSNIRYAAKCECITYNYYRHDISIMSSTNTDRIIDAYSEFKKLSNNIENAEVHKYMLSRWVLGCLREVSRRYDYETWKKFGNSVDYSKHLINLITFPHAKIRILALIGTINKRVLYQILKQ